MMATRSRRRVGMSGGPTDAQHPSTGGKGLASYASSSSPASPKKFNQFTSLGNGKVARTIYDVRTSGEHSSSQQQHTPSPKAPEKDPLRQSTKRKASETALPESSPLKASRTARSNTASDARSEANQLDGLGLDFSVLTAPPQQHSGSYYAEPAQSPSYSSCLSGAGSPTRTASFSHSHFGDDALQPFSAPPLQREFGLPMSPVQQMPATAQAAYFDPSCQSFPGQNVQHVFAPRAIRPLPLLRRSAPASSENPFQEEDTMPSVFRPASSAAPPVPAVPVQYETNTNARTPSPAKGEATPKKKRIRKRAPPKGTPQYAMSADPDAPVHVPRPPNAWIMYRSAKVAELKNDPEQEGKLQADISKIVGMMWRSEKPEVVAHYQQMAEEKKMEHYRLHPEYRFTPQRKGGSKPSSPTKRPSSKKSKEADGADPAFSPSRKSKALSRSSPASVAGSRHASPPPPVPSLPQDIPCLPNQSPAMFSVDSYGLPSETPESLFSHQGAPSSMSMSMFDPPCAPTRPTFSQSGYAQPVESFDSQRTVSFQQKQDLLAQQMNLASSVFVNGQQYPLDPSLAPSLNQSTMSHNSDRSNSSELSVLLNSMMGQHSPLALSTGTSSAFPMTPSSAGFSMSTNGLPFNMQTMSLGDQQINPVNQLRQSTFQWVEDPIPMEAASANMTPCSSQASSSNLSSAPTFFSPADLDPTYNFQDWSTNLNQNGQAINPFDFSSQFNLTPENLMHMSTTTTTSTQWIDQPVNANEFGQLQQSMPAGGQIYESL